jgi:hypothetical protein
MDVVTDAEELRFVLAVSANERPGTSMLMASDPPNGPARRRTHRGGTHRNRANSSRHESPSEACPEGLICVRRYNLL